MDALSGGPGKPALLEETIGACLRRIAGEWAEREALVSCEQGLRFTYAELDAAVDRLARGLLAAGLERGDRVGIWSPNCAEWTLAQFATARTGVILVNVNPAYRTSELAYALRHSGCRMLISARETKNSDYAAMVEEVRGDLPELERVVWLDDPSWEELLAAGDDVDAAGARGPRGGAHPRAADQHPVHERHHRPAEGRHAQPPQHPQQRVPGRRGLPLRRARPESASRSPSTTASAW